ncbi:uncharacterized protein M421DRAFT_93576 [Didymella exigua CBS 183.55]|uniref:Uncharacterized protein n=1 Tax=Didymella exigua CBS 183.55 TaxID=1150837 RepID=A0A6A5RGX5_9PLEO|nr:uncharacterized protein M421DRAFT_93576 [Didymella exigua CBS 183.55]KAF1927002.1 hypothetical protein M421DRAFT_93576 [Didymella exigua CBS 183.55]
MMLKYEHFKREVISFKEKLKEFEARDFDMKESLYRSCEGYRLIIIERDQTKENLHDQHNRYADYHRQINTLEQSFRHAEETVVNIRAEIDTLTECNKVLMLEGDDSCSKHSHLHNEFSELREKLLVFQADIQIDWRPSSSSKACALSFAKRANRKDALFLRGKPPIVRETTIFPSTKRSAVRCSALRRAHQLIITHTAS